MNIMRTISGLSLGLALLLAAGASDAAGTALDSNDLPAKYRTELRTEIDKARGETPELFRAVFDVAARAKELDEASRAPGIPLTRHFKNLGPRAFYPLMEMMVFDSHAPRGLPASAESALRIGVIEAVGTIRDPRATPALARILEQSRDLDSVRASASALGKIGTDDAVTILTDAAKKARTADSARERAILGGMHDCRREAAARFLADRLDAQPDADTAKVLAKALGGVGNSWAWKTLSSQQEAASTRHIAATSLVRAYVRYRGDVREAAAKALLVVDDAGTPSLIAKEKAGAPRELATALEELERRFATNPAR